MFRKLLAASLLLSLGACEEADDSIKFGAKNFGESRVLAHMMAELAAEQGLPVAGVVDYPSTQAIQEALKRGDIDAYPEYNGTGLVMLGQNPMTDGDAATARVKEIYEPLGFSWRAKFGFANDYGLAMRSERAAELGISTMSELVSRAGELKLGVEDDFTKRPLDGLDAMKQRYGFDFGSTVEIELSERAKLYDQLLEGELDLIEVYTTDGQIADYGLTILKDDLNFFPVYEASPVASAASLSSFEGFGAVLDSLASKIDAAAMQDLNRKVDIEGRDPKAVARDALARLELIKSGAVASSEPLIIAAAPDVSEGAAATAALRAARAAFAGQDVQIAPLQNPLDAVKSGDARIALVGADAFFDITGPAPSRSDAFEAVAAVDQSLIHIVVHQSGPTNLSDITSFATGDEGSSSYKLGDLISTGLELGAQPTPGASDSVADLLGRLGDGSTEAAIVFAPEGDRALVDAFESGNYRLLSVSGWSGGPNLVKYPFLRPARVAAQTYKGQFGAVETLGAQLVLAGPAELQTGDVVGNQGPSAVETGLSPISSTAVLALNEAISGSLLVDPTLKQAVALAPALPVPPAGITPAPDISILNLLVVALFVWLIWLYIRPEHR